MALTGGANVEQLAARRARNLNAQIAVTAYDDRLPALREALAGSGIEAAAGEAAIAEAAARPADWIMSAIVGAAGLAPGMAALQHGTTLALANKESLVTAGPLADGRRRGARRARSCRWTANIRRCFRRWSARTWTAVERIIITASGGAFRDWPLEALAPRDARRGVQPPELGHGPADHHRFARRCSTSRWN